MINSNNIDVMRQNIRRLSKAQDPAVIENLITNVEANTDAIGDLNALVGSAPLPEGKTITSALPHYVDVTRNTNDSGYLLFTASEAPVDKVISCQVLEPSRQACELWVNTVGDDHYFGYVHTRGVYDTKLVSTSCKVRIWMTN